ncbi:ROK family protein [Mycobacterium marinum]|uniref:ROK family protein n=1 Tax=Mycobacterium marinum TaxID=1781 RepID=UPI0023583193|nr:ROK family protein [Mycobacterium marinum]MDC9004513.1 ROK family protein [Mycobacterium marinum]
MTTLATDIATSTMAADLGGTWLRLQVGGPGTEVKRHMAPSLLNFPEQSVAQLRERLVDELCAAAPAGAHAAISCGAALDHRRGILYGSGPLWGAEAAPFDLAEALRLRRPDVTWLLVNDLTAGLADFTARWAGPSTRRIGYLTISSGIALRIADLRTSEIPVDEWGLQGEVGHLPTQADPALRGLMCECGVPDHLAAHASGPGIGRIAGRLGALPPNTSLLQWFPGALAAGDAAAVSVLKAAVAPIAALIRMLWCVDPHLDLLGIGGGVVEGLGSHYERELREQLRGGSCYADRGFSESWLDERLVFCADSSADIDCLRGAQLMCDERLKATA